MQPRSGSFSPQTKSLVCPSENRLCPKAIQTRTGQNRENGGGGGTTGCVCVCVCVSVFLFLQDAASLKQEKRSGFPFGFPLTPKQSGAPSFLPLCAGSGFRMATSKGGGGVRWVAVKKKKKKKTDRESCAFRRAVPFQKRGKRQNLACLPIEIASRSKRAPTKSPQLADGFLLKNGMHMLF